MDRDPTPGNPDEVRELADDLQTFADDVGEALGRIRGMAEDRAVLDWAGLSAEAFRSEFDGVPPNLQKLQTSYDMAAQALQTYWPKLETAQGMADRALDRAIAAQADLSTAQAALSDAQDWVSRAGDEAERLEREGERENVEPPSEAEVRAATRDATAANEAASSAQSRVDSAGEALSAARQLALDAKEMREEAARTCASEIDAASDAGIQNRRWWEDAIHWVSENWDTIVEICKVVVAVLGIVVMIIGGPLAWVVLAAALVVLADTLYDYANGRATLWDVAFAALDCIPGMKGLTTLGGLARGLRGGLSAARTGLRAYAGNLRNLRSMWRAEGIQGAGRVLVGDPIDIATGEMTLRNTDLNLPGALPLLLEREHLSSYRHGRWFGPSWTSTLDQRLVVDEYGVDLYCDDGMRLHYPVPLADPEVPVLPVEGPRWGLAWDGRPGGTMTVRQEDTGRTLHFGPVPGRPGRELAITAITDRNANRIDFHYTDEGAPSEVVHSGGYRVGVAVHNGRVTSLTLLHHPDRPLLRAFDYDEKGDLGKVFNASGLPHTFEYDDQHRMTRWEDRNHTWYRYEYDDAGRCVFTTGTDRCLEYRYAYDVESRRTTATDSLGNSTVFQLNDRYRLVSETDALGNVTSREWDEDNRLLAVTDPLGRTIRYAYDERGNVALLTRPDGTQVRAEYNELGLPTEVVEADGGTWSFAYDAAGNQTVVVNPAGQRTRFGYDRNGALVSVTDAHGHQSRTRCDAAGLPVAHVDALGEVTTVARDPWGRPVLITDPLGATTALDWSVEGDLVRRTNPLGAVQTFAWDDEGNLLTHTDANGGQTNYTYGPFDMPVTMTLPDGTGYSFTRDTELNLTSITNPLGATWIYTYDAAGRLTAETDFDGRLTTYEVDAAGQLLARTNTAGQTLRFRYDAAGRVVGKETSDGEVMTFSLDALGQITTATSPGVKLSRTYGPLGSLLTETVNGRVLSLTHDVMGRLLSRRTPAGHTSDWTYTPTGLPATLTTDHRTLSFQHDPAGRETSRRIGEGLRLARRWDPAGRATTQTLTGPAAQVISTRAHAYRADDHLTELNDQHIGSHAFALDVLGRVTAAVGPDWHESYTYSPTGDQTSAQWPGADPDDAGDREYAGTLLTGAGRVHYEHDAAGRVIRRRHTTLSGTSRTWEYTWNAEDQLTRTITPDGTTWTYTYDPFGRRVAKQRLAADGQVAERTVFTWHDTVLIEQATTMDRAAGSDEEAAGPVALTWNHLGHTPITQTRYNPEDRNETNRRFHAIVTDLVGTPVHLVDETGRLAWSQRAAVWGARARTTGDADTPLRLPGQYRDEETGWHYNYFRHYEPASGRFVTRDPLGLGPAPNPYAYPHNPHTWSDPLGLAPHNVFFRSRGEAFNAARDRAGVPNSQQPSRQWEVGADPTQRGRTSNYVYDPNPGAHGRYYQYETPNGTRVIAEHTADPNAPYPHFHAGQPKDGTYSPNMMGERYQQVGDKHHFYYTG